MTIHDQSIFMSAFCRRSVSSSLSDDSDMRLNNLFRFLVLQNLSSQGSICRTEMALLII